MLLLNEQSLLLEIGSASEITLGMRTGGFEDLGGPSLRPLKI